MFVTASVKRLLVPMPLKEIKADSHILRTICDRGIHKPLRKKLLKSLDSERYIGHISELLLNLYCDRIPLTNSDLKILRPLARSLYFLASPKKTASNKHKFLLRGNRIDTILVPIIPALLNSIERGWGEIGSGTPAPPPSPTLDQTLCTSHE